MSDFSPIRALIGRVGRRVRAQRAIEAISTMLILSGAWLILAVFLLKIRHLGPAHLSLILGLAVLFPLTALLLSLLRPVRPMVAAQLIDSRLGLKDRIGSAYDFTRRGGGELSPYAAAQVREAAAKARVVRPQEAMPLRVPRRLGVFVGQLLAVAVLVALPAFPVHQEAQAALAPPEVEGMTVDFDELDGFNDFLRDVHQEALDEELDEVAQAAEEFNRLLQDLADQRLLYRDALERIAALEQKISRDQWEPDPEAEQFLKQVGQDLQRSKITKEAGEALEENDLRKARDEVRDAAARAKREPPDRQRLEELRRALEKAAQREPPNSEERLAELQQQEQRRLKQKNQPEKQSQAEKRRLKRDRRELERLQRNLERQRERQRQLERLQRDLQQAAESLNLSAAEQQQLEELLEQMGEDLNRMAREQQSEQQMRSLQERLEELRRLLQQLQRGGKGFKTRLGQFNKGASCGGGDGKGGGQLSLQPGGGSKGAGLKLGQLPGQGAGQGQKGQDGQGGGKGGQGAGTEHDPNTFGDPTKIKAQYTDVQVNPEAQHEGPSRQQVIETAADQGFASKSYGEVHESFERHAESLLEKQDVPPGYRRYIRLYFERIRPR